MEHEKIHLEPGETCPYCGQKKRSLPKTKWKNPASAANGKKGGRRRNCRRKETRGEEGTRQERGSGRNGCGKETRCKENGDEKDRCKKRRRIISEKVF